MTTTRLRVLQAGVHVAWLTKVRFGADLSACRYEFEYVPWLEGFPPHPAFHYWITYRSWYLWPVFADRLASPRRADYAEWAARHGITEEDDDIERLAKTRGARATDNWTLERE